MHQLNRSVVVNGQRASALRTTDLRVLALWHVLVWFPESSDLCRHFDKLEEEIDKRIQRAKLAA